MKNNLKYFIETAMKRNDQMDVYMVYNMDDKAYITYMLNGKTYEDELAKGYMTAISNKVKNKNKVILTMTNDKGKMVNVPVEDIVKIKEVPQE